MPVYVRAPRNSDVEMKSAPGAMMTALAPKRAKKIAVVREISCRTARLSPSAV
jgi:hypothetical protein